MWLNQLFNIIWLVVSTPLKNISKFWLLFPYIMEKKNMFQTTNQIIKWLVVYHKYLQ